MTTARQLETDMRASLSSRMIAEFSSLKRVLLVDRNSGLTYVRHLPQHKEILVSLLCPDLLNIKKEQMNYYDQVIEGDVNAPDLQRALQISQAETLLINVDQINDAQKEEIVKLLAHHPDYTTLSIIVITAKDLVKASSQSTKPSKRGFFAKLRGSATSNASSGTQNGESEGVEGNRIPPEQAFAPPDLLTRTTLVKATTVAAAAAAAASETNSGKNGTRSSSKIKSGGFRFSSRGRSSLRGSQESIEQSTQSPASPNDDPTTTAPPSLPSRVEADIATDNESSMSQKAPSWMHKKDQTDSLADWIHEEIMNEKYQGCLMVVTTTGMEATLAGAATAASVAARHR